MAHLEQLAYLTQPVCTQSRLFFSDCRAQCCFDPSRVWCRSEEFERWSIYCVIVSVNIYDRHSYYYQAVSESTMAISPAPPGPPFPHASLLYLLSLTLLWIPSLCQQLITISNPRVAGQTVTVYNRSANPMLNSSFFQYSDGFNCSLSPLFTYSQSDSQYKNNTAYSLTITSPSTNTTITTTITTEYNSINAQLNSSQSVTCTAFPCLLEVRNNCPLPKLNYFNYFDVVRLNFSTLDFVVSYYVLCNSQFDGTSFEWGLFIEIAFCMFLITLTALYSNAWSIGGAGWRISLPLVLFFNILISVGGIVAVFKFEVVEIAVNVLSWGFGIAAVWLCTNQSLFLLKRVSVLRYELFKVKQISVRVLDLASLGIALIVCFAWWFSNKNWIINDIIAVCMIIAAMKVLKFTSLKQALICFCITIGVEMVFVLVLTFNIKKNYNTVILNIFNNPFELQVPTINPVYNQKCAWLPVTAIIFPGCLMSYMRRFDSSRNTRVYIITCVSVFGIGSIIWMFVSIASQNSLPFGLIAEPATLGFISFFAWKRKEIRTLWTGKFYDEQFAHKEGLKTISESIQREGEKTDIIYSPQLFLGLHIKQDQSSLDHPEPAKRQQANEKQSISDKISETDRSLITKTQSVYGEKVGVQFELIPRKTQINNQKKEGQALKDLSPRPRVSKFPMAIQKGAL